MSAVSSDVTIYTVGDREHGLGHVVRMKLLARLLVERGLHVSFCSIPKTLGWDMLASTGMPISGNWYLGAVGIVDIESGPDGYLLGKARNMFGRVVTVYGGHSFPLTAPDAVERLSDLVVCQSIFEFDRPAHVLQGPRYIMIDPRFANIKINPDGPRVVVMGGTDPHDLTPKVKAALGYPNSRLLFPNGEPSLVPFFTGASRFIGALGMVAYEAIAAGMPAALYSWSDNHKATADELERRGVAISLGLWSDFEESQGRMIDFAWGSYWMYKSGSARIIDGQGAGRVADAICKLM